MRDAWLDLLRAAAIAAVAAYHTVQMCPVRLPIAKWTRFGALGVDLFFVLSGFLIGTLYWRERQSAGRIDLIRFWQRRWWRTLPAYYAALALAWLATFVARREPFDPAYLVFLQNYERELPFFLVSWSLCIEEHFYLLLPPLLLLSEAVRVPMPWVLGTLLPSSSVLRYLEARDGVAAEFGFEHTATHLHMEGLLMGFALSALFVLAPELAARAQRAASWLLVPLVVLAAWSTVHSDRQLAYVLSSGTVALALSAVLLAGVGRAPSTYAGSAWILRLALISYSVYLTHALAIHVARLLCARWSIGVAGYFVLAPSLILLAGTAFYAAVERPSLHLRERIAPRRATHA